MRYILRPEPSDSIIECQCVYNRFSKMGADWLKHITTAFARRDALLYNASRNQPFVHFFEKALADEGGCLCQPGKHGLFISLATGLLYHDKMALARLPKPLATFADWVSHTVLQSFPDRKTALLVEGGSGTGKTTLARSIQLMYPKYFCATPIYGDTFPWSAFMEHTLYIALNDLRLTDGMQPDVLLNLLEKAEGFSVGRKNQPQVELQDIANAVITITTNYLQVSKLWTSVDIGALHDRIYNQIVLAHELPKRNNACTSACRWCAARFLVWCTQHSAAGKAIFEKHKNKLPDVQLVAGKAPSLGVVSHAGTDLAVEPTHASLEDELICSDAIPNEPEIEGDFFDGFD